MKTGLQCALAMTVVLPNLLLATAQVPDKLVFQGETNSLFANPLEQYLQGKDRPAVLKGGVMSTACWRGYMATWQIDKDRLHLLKVEKMYHKEKTGDDIDLEWREVPLKELIPGQKAPIFAEWFTGTLTVPKGKRLRYVHMGYASVYEKEIRIKIARGKVEAIAEIDNAQSPALTDPDRAKKEIEKMAQGGGLDPDHSRKQKQTEPGK